MPRELNINRIQGLYMCKSHANGARCHENAVNMQLSIATFFKIVKISCQLNGNDRTKEHCTNHNPVGNFHC